MDWLLGRDLLAILVGCFLVAGQERRQFVGACLGVGFTGFGRRARIGEPQGFGQPSGVGEEAFGLLGHVTLLQMLDELRGPVSGAFTHGLDDPALRHPTEIVIDGRPPSGLHHVKTGGVRKPVSLGETVREPVLGHAVPAIGVRLLVKRIDAEAHAMGKQREPARIVKRRQPVPERLIVLRKIGFPGVLTLRDRACGGTVLQVGGLRGEEDVSHGRFQASAASGGALERVDDELVQQRRQRDLRMARHGVAQRERAMGGQFDH